jgi:hypothetical protein
MLIQANALGIGADTGHWLRPVQYERIARPQERPNYNFGIRMFYFGF